MFQTGNLALRNVDLNDRDARGKAVKEILHVKVQRGRSHDRAWFETQEEYPNIFAVMLKTLNIWKNSRD